LAAGIAIDEEPDGSASVQQKKEKEKTHAPWQNRVWTEWQ
jgi:hypothetical protein